MKFAELDLRPEILSALEELQFAEATPIQETVIPHILKGKDVSGLAQTGTGKTGAFVIPLLDRWLRSRDKEVSPEVVEGQPAGPDRTDRIDKEWKPNSFYLVLVPTRELAAQVEEAVTLLGKNSGAKSVMIAGGNSYDDQKKALREGVQFVVGTPGRLLDLYKSHDLDLNGVRAIVFDEADRMFDMGFKDDMKFILRRVPKDRQLLLFSATLNFEVQNTAYQFGAEPIEFNVSKDQATAEGIDHEILHVGHEEKPMYLLSIIKRMSPQQCIVFSNFKNNVTRIAKFLKDNGVEATAMSSLLSQAQRNKVLETFKTGNKAILVATDVAARGLDIKGVDLVVNFELPDDPEGYVHRIGRTGRAGTHGRAVGLVCDRDVDAMARIETYLKEKLKIGWYEEADLVKEFAPFPPFEHDRPKFTERPRGPSASGGRSSSGPRPSSGPRREGGSSSGPRHDNRPPRPNKPHSANSSDGTKRDSRPQGPRTEGNRPAQPDSQRAFAGQHRDRKTGRHSGHGTENAQGTSNQGNQGNQGNQSNQGGQNNRPPARGNGRNESFKRRPLGQSNPRNASGTSGGANKPRTSAAKPAISVTGKIKSMFSKLFK